MSLAGNAAAAASAASTTDTSVAQAAADKTKLRDSSLIFRQIK